jgi:hypothetical protein
MVWTGFANVENEPNPPFDVIEREQFRQCDVCDHRDRSLSRQERVNVREKVQAVLRRQDVTEREQFRQCDVCDHRDRSLSRQERVNVREKVQAVLRRQDDTESPAAATQEHVIIMTRNGSSGNE